MKYNSLNWFYWRNLCRVPHTLPKHELRKGFIYQIYVRSFKDSNGDGIGDLNGITSTLEYIKSLGARAIWLTPIYPSAGADGGYDVSNYKAIDPIYGTMKDFKRLVKKARKLGIVVMLDMVFNHTSSNHMWFKKALKGHKRYQNYYIFKKGDKDGNPPNGLVSKFGGNAWEFVKERGDWFLHLFSKEQPDLNWSNRQVRDELKSVINFWKKLGVGGLRFDVINLISKRPFEEYKGGDGREIYTDGPMMHDYLKELHEECFLLFKDKKIFSVGEMSSPSLKECAKYTNPSSCELDTVFVFNHLKSDYVDGKKFGKREFNIRKFNDIIDEMALKLQEGGGTLSFVLECHDQERVVSRFGDALNYRYESATLYGALTMLIPGIPCIYQGQEIGMTNMTFSSLDEIDDVESKNAINKLRNEGKSDAQILAILNQCSRDHARSSMQHNATLNGGFSKYQREHNGTIIRGGVALPRTNPNYTNINVESDLANDKSIIAFFKELAMLRRTLKAINSGLYSPMRLCESVISFKLSYEEQSVIFIGNCSDSKVSAKDNLDGYEVILDNYKVSKDEESTRNITLMPFEVKVLLKG